LLLLLAVLERTATPLPVMHCNIFLKGAFMSDLWYDIENTLS